MPSSQKAGPAVASGELHTLVHQEVELADQY